MKLSFVSFVYAMFALGGAWVFLRFVMKPLMPPEEVRKYLTWWAVLAAIYFFSPNPLVFSIGAVVFLLSARQKFEPLAASAFFLIALPPGMFQFGDLPGINYLLRIKFAFLVAAIFALPVALRSMSLPARPGGKLVDLSVVFVTLVAVTGTMFTTTFTNGLREAVVQIVSLMAVYFAVSRGIRTQEHFEKVLAAFLLIIVVAAAVGIAASIISWDFFLTQETRLFDTFNRVKARAGRLRVSGLFGGAYADLATTMMIGLMSCAFVIAAIKNNLARYGAILFFLTAIVITGSRGPLVAFVLALPLLFLSRPNTASLMVQTLIGTAVLIFAASLTESGREILEMLPFIGSSSSGEIDYRQDLLDRAILMIKMDPWNGDPNYINHPLLDDMVQGEGMVDIVNDYVGVALRYGLPTALVYFYVQTVPGLQNILLARRLGRSEELDRWRWIGGGLGAALLVYALAYATTSKRSYSEEIGWFLIGMNVAYYRITRDTGLVSSGLAARRNSLAPAAQSAE